MLVPIGGFKKMRIPLQKEVNLKNGLILYCMTDPYQNPLLYDLFCSWCKNAFMKYWNKWWFAITCILTFAWQNNAVVEAIGDYIACCDTGAAESNVRQYHDDSHHHTILAAWYEFFCGVRTSDSSVCTDQVGISKLLHYCILGLLHSSTIAFYISF